MYGRYPMVGPMRSPGFMNMPFYNMQPFAPRPGLGGFLARLFSRGQAPLPGNFGMAMPTMPNAANMMNSSGGISGMLGNIQKALGVVQQVTPMVQQYGPLVKNIPSMIKLFRELEPADETSSDTKQEAKTETKKERDVPATSNKKNQSESIKELKGVSKPKLYI